MLPYQLYRAPKLHFNLRLQHVIMRNPWRCMNKGKHMSSKTQTIFLNIIVIWDVIPCLLVISYPHFGVFCHHLQGSPRTVSCMEKMVSHPLSERMEKPSPWGYTTLACGLLHGWQIFFFSVGSPSSLISSFFAPYSSNVSYPQLHPLNNTVPPLGSLSPQFPYMMHHLFHTIYFSCTTLKWRRRWQALLKHQ